MSRPISDDHISIFNLPPEKEESALAGAPSTDGSQNANLAVSPGELPHPNKRRGHLQGRYILGLDLGASSLGWSVIECDESGTPIHLENMGVRLFQDGRKQEKNPRPGLGDSLGAERRVAASVRRRMERSFQRRKKLLNLLQDSGLVRLTDDPRHPDDVDPKHPFILIPGQHFHDDRAKMACTPIDWTDALSRRALAHTLYHLGRHRGMRLIAASMASEEEEKKIGKLTKSANAFASTFGNRVLSEVMRDHWNVVRIVPHATLRPRTSTRTQDERNAARDIDENYKALPTVTVTREMVAAELAAIRRTQSSDPLDDAWWDRLTALIVEDPKPRAGELWPCPYVPGEVRLRRSHPLAQELLLRDRIANVRYRTTLSDDAQRLTPEQCDLVYDILSRQKVLSANELKIAARLSLDVILNIERRKDGKAQLIGHAFPKLADAIST